MRRKQLGLTQSQLAADANLTQAAIYKIELGGATRQVGSIAKALGVSTHWLIYGVDEDRRGTGYWPFRIARLQDLETLPPKKRRELDRRLADFIAGAMKYDDSSFD